MKNAKKIERYIKEYTEGGETLYQVYICKVSRHYKNLRVQKRIRAIETLERARKLRDKWNDQLILDLRVKENRGFTWREIVEKWELYWREFPTRTFNDATLYDHISRINNWTQCWMTRPANSLKIRDARELIRDACDAGASIRLRKMIKRTVNCVIKWAIEEGMITDYQISPAKNIEILMPGERLGEAKRPEILSWIGIHKLLTTAKIKESSWFPIWFMAIHTGLRSGELEALSKDNLELVPLSVAKKLDLLPDGDSRKSYGFILVQWAWQSKGKKYGPTKAHYWRQVPVNQELYYFLLDLIENDFGTNTLPDLSDSEGKRKIEVQRLLPLIQDWRRGVQAKHLRLFCEQNGLQSIKFHTLRACFATQLLSMGVAEEQVKKVGGWKDVETMQRYVRAAGILESGSTQGLKFMDQKEEFDVNSPYRNIDFVKATDREGIHADVAMPKAVGESYPEPENVVNISNFRNR